MVKLRLKRFGRKKSPFYRVVAISSASKRQGAPLEELGYYDPIRKLLKLNLDHVTSWVTKGAEVSDAVQRLIKLADGRTGELIELPKREKPVVVAPEPVVIEKAPEPVVAEASPEPVAAVEETIAEVPITELPVAEVAEAPEAIADKAEATEVEVTEALAEEASTT
jgi:small subunit ribosomal protein S16